MHFPYKFIVHLQSRIPTILVEPSPPPHVSRPYTHIHTHMSLLAHQKLNIVESTNPSIHTSLLAHYTNVTSLWNPQIHTKLDLLTRNLNVLFVKLTNSYTLTYIHTSLLAHYICGAHKFIHTHIFACSFDTYHFHGVHKSIHKHTSLLAHFRNVTSLWNPQIHPSIHTILLAH